MAYFTIIYGFMASLLHLEGFSKQIYAVIFGFWIHFRKAVCVPYSVIRGITGATDPTISECVKRLEKVGLITVERRRGMRTMYEIIFTDEIKEAFLHDSGQDETAEAREELNEPKDATKVPRESTKFPKGHKQRKNSQSGDSTPTSNLIVPSACSVSSRVKTVKIKPTS